MQAPLLHILRQVFFEQRHADKAIESSLRQTKLSQPERGALVDTAYGIIRYWRLLWHLQQQTPCDNDKALQSIVEIYQIIAQNKKTTNAKVIWQRLADTTKREILQSVPDWLDEWGARELPDTWDTVLAALNTAPSLVIRVNTLKISKKDLEQRLLAQEIPTQSVENAPDALLLPQKINLFALPEFKEGLFELQDSSSQQVAALLGAGAGMRVIDACAGAGGKTLHISALMQNKGRIVAMDTEQWKLEALKKRARRAGANNIETRWIEDGKTIKRLADTADCLLLDVPCSGLGVLRRNPDAKWHLQPENILELQQTQRYILDHYPRMLKKGGKMVYATCSILPSENQLQVQRFLSETGNDFILLKEQQISPISGFDGFYVALMERKA